ncbi:MAG: TatD family hydrolase [Gammaproteobacteria bacterium]|nr:TatD family hydrolase [Gammaproteobacteria bacterium]
MFIDSHCHLDMLTPVKESGAADAVLTAARDAGVKKFICIGVNLDDLPAMRQLVKPYDDVWTTVGVHPCAQPEAEPTVEELVELAADERCVAIGETGLDYHYDQVPREVQQERFRRHVRAAVKTDKPLVIHTRDAREDTIRILKEEGAEHCGGVLHCFTESLEMAEAVLPLNFCISFSGIVSFRNAESLREVARKLPQDRILVETDAPYLAPVPKRGKENQPAWVKHVAECIAETRGDSLADVAKYTTRNTERLFRI